MGLSNGQRYIDWLEDALASTIETYLVQLSYYKDMRSDDTGVAVNTSLMELGACIERISNAISCLKVIEDGKGDGRGNGRRDEHRDRQGRKQGYKELSRDEVAQGNPFDGDSVFNKNNSIPLPSSSSSSSFRSTRRSASPSANGKNGSSDRISQHSSRRNIPKPIIKKDVQSSKQMDSRGIHQVNGNTHQRDNVVNDYRRQGGSDNHQQQGAVNEALAYHVLREQGIRSGDEELTYYTIQENDAPVSDNQMIAMIRGLLEEYGVEPDYIDDLLGMHQGNHVLNNNPPRDNHVSDNDSYQGNPNGRGLSGNTFAMSSLSPKIVPVVSGYLGGNPGNGNGNSLNQSINRSPNQLPKQLSNQSPNQSPTPQPSVPIVDTYVWNLGGHKVLQGMAGKEAYGGDLPPAIPHIANQGRSYTEQLSQQTQELLAANHNGGDRSQGNGHRPSNDHSQRNGSDRNQGNESDRSQGNSYYQDELGQEDDYYRMSDLPPSSSLESGDFWGLP